MPLEKGNAMKNAQVTAAIGRQQEARERSRAPSTAPSKANYSAADIAYTAKIRGITEAQVRQQLGIQ
jgi:hypothetical protein